MEDVDPDFYVDPKEFSALAHVVEALEYSDNTGDALDARNRFKQGLQNVEQRVDEIVESNYHGFNGSVRSFSEIFLEFTQAQNRVRNLKKRVKNCRTMLTNRKRNLGSLTYERHRCEKILEILKNLRSLQEAPLKVNSYLRNGDYNECVNIIQNANQMCQETDLKEIKILFHLQEEIQASKAKIVKSITSSLLEKLAQNVYRPESRDYFLRYLKCLKSLTCVTDAIHNVKDCLRKQIQGVIASSASEHQKVEGPFFADFMSRREGEVRELEDIVIHDVSAVKSSFSKILSTLEVSLLSHRTFSEVLSETCGNKMAEAYSLRETWSVIQVEVQEFLDSHLIGDASKPHCTKSHTFENSHASSLQELSRIHFNFDVRDSTVSSVRKGFPNLDGISLDRIQPLSKPSPYWIIPLYNDLVEFSSKGTILIDAPSQKQLWNYVHMFCKEVLLRNILQDGLGRLKLSLVERSSAMPMVAFIASTDVYMKREVTSDITLQTKEEALLIDNGSLQLRNEIIRLFRFQKMLSSSLSLEDAINTLLEEYLLRVKEKIRLICKSDERQKFSWEHTKKLSEIIKDCPFYKEDMNEYPESRSLEQAARAYNAYERANELLLEGSPLGKHSFRIWKQLENPFHGLFKVKEIVDLCTLHTGCDWVFRNVMNPLPSDEEDGMRSKIEAWNTLFGSQRNRSLLAEIDNAAETCLFLVRSDLRLLCSFRIHQIVQELVSKSLRFTPITKLGEELTQISKALTKCISAKNYGFIFNSLPVLCAELLIRTVLFTQTETRRVYGETSIGPSHTEYLKHGSLALENIFWAISAENDACSQKAFAASRLLFHCFDLQTNRKNISEILTTASHLIESISKKDMLSILQGTLDP